MTDIEKKALALVKAAVSAGQMRMLPTYVDKAGLCEALFRAIEQHEAFRQEVSDAVEGYASMVGLDPKRYFARFIIAKPDPLVEVMNEMGFGMSKTASEEFRAALAARGLEIREKQP